MSSAAKIGRNALCLCGSGKKYKHCCYSRVDWAGVAAGGYSSVVRHLSVRGKNMHFLNRMAGALQVDKLAAGDTSQFKKAFTPTAIRQIYEAIGELWPSSLDLSRALSQEAERSSGLYVGNYSPDIIERAVTRHTIYSDTLLLVDPFSHPWVIREEYNPLVYPEHYRAAAFRSALLWFQLAPWIDAGIVRFVRTPGDLDLQIAHQSDEIQTASFQKHPELRELIEEFARDDWDPTSPMMESLAILCQPDSVIAAKFSDRFPDSSSDDVGNFLAYVRRRRIESPYYMEPVPDADGNLAQLTIQSTGASYDMAKRVAALTKSHLITDLPTRWKEIEIDRAEAGIDERQWSPFAKAFHNLDIHYLDSVPLEAALKLRKEDRLGELRSFLRKIWKAAVPENSFSEASVENLGVELREKVREAEDEWAKIDREVIRWITSTTGIGAVASVISTGGAEWTSAAVGAVTGGIGSLAMSFHQRRTFAARYPASFFLKLKKNHKSR